MKRWGKRLAALVLALAGAAAAGQPPPPPPVAPVADPVPAADPAPAGDVQGELPERFARWLEEVDPLITTVERQLFKTLSRDYQRQAFI